jgi:hypothetical protein
MRTSPSTRAQDMEQVFPWVGLNVNSHAIAGQRRRPVAPMGGTVATSPDGHVAGVHRAGSVYQLSPKFRHGALETSIE